MPSIKSKIKKALKIIGITFGIIVMLGIVSLTFVYKMENRSFPLEALELKDATLLGDWGAGKANYFRVRVTNKESFGARDIKIKIDFYGKDKSPIDGDFITFYDDVPPRSTRNLKHGGSLSIEGLPPNGEWTWSYSIIDAKRTW